jgi:hypothetical protein
MGDRGFVDAQVFFLAVILPLIRASLRCCWLFGRVKNVIDGVVVYFVVEVEEEEEVDED